MSAGKRELAEGLCGTRRFESEGNGGRESEIPGLERVVTNLGGWLWG
jgi:hypothetical protein